MVAAEPRLPLAADKEESVVLRGGCGRKKRRKSGLNEKVKWLGLILDDRLDFKEHWRHQIGKSRSLLGALGGVGNSRWGMSLISWRAGYMGMFRAVASWGVEISWRGQKEWRQEMTLLQNAAMRKTLGAVWRRQRRPHTYFGLYTRATEESCLLHRRSHVRPREKERKEKKR